MRQRDGEGMLGRLYRRLATPVMRSQPLGVDFPDAVGVATLLVLRAVRDQVA